MIEDDNEHTSENLEAATLYIYADQFVIEPETKLTNIKCNLVINRKTKQIKEINHQNLDKSEPMEGNYLKKAAFSLFLGILPILDKEFLIFGESCQKVWAIEGQDVFELKDISIIPFDDESAFEKESSQKSNTIFNYILYLKNYLLKEGYYFSYEYELTLSRQSYSEGYPPKLSYAWNLHIGRALLKLQDRGWFIPLIQGSIRAFKVFLQGKKVEYILITRRSWKKGGTRYNARGIDIRGYVANYCETQQLIFINNYCFSHAQIRGSVPTFWKQSGIYAEVQFYKTHEETKSSFLKHFNKLERDFERVFCLNLLSKQKSGEIQLTLYFEQLIKENNLDFLRYEFFDFHYACKGQKFERANYLINKIQKVNHFFKYYTENIEQKKVLSLQKGIMRTNCLDCLDRTNLIQSKVAYQVLDVILSKCGFDNQTIFGCDSVIGASDDANTTSVMIINLKNTWADNGDMISRHYTGTGSTHTNVTRTGKRDLRGIMDHGFKTLGRFYKQYMEDNFKQEVIDILIGEHTETINLAEFESRLKKEKPGQSLSSDFLEI